MLVLLAVVLVFAVSGGMLWWAGLNYDGLSGSPAAKIHPATYLSVVLLPWAALRSGDPVGFAVEISRRRPASLLLLLAALALVANIVARSGSGLAGAFDTFVGPAILVMAMDGLDERDVRPIEAALHLVMAVNAVFGLAEFASGTRVFPYRFDGAIFASDTRSAALQGHPLANATVTSVYALALIAGGGSLARAVRMPLVVLQLAALVTFGGRSAVVVTAVLGCGFGIVAANRVLRTGRVPLVMAAAVVGVLTLAPLAIGSLAALGFFDRLADRFVADGGSANARIEMFDLLARLPLRDLLFGPDAALVDSLRRVSGLEWGIENPFIRTMLYQGIFMTALIAVAVILFCAELVRRAGPGTFLPVAGFAILINTSESLAGKTTLLTKFALIVLLLYRPVAGQRGAAR